MPQIHLCIIQPIGYIHSLGFLDQARFFRYQFRLLGAEVTLEKNRLRYGAINFIFGAHLGFDTDLTTRYNCIFVNLEQLGPQGSKLRPEYLNLLKNNPTVDYHTENPKFYKSNHKTTPTFSFAYAPYLENKNHIPLQDRPIDLLFIGSMNERRKTFIEIIESYGHNITLFSSPVYGPERDYFIQNSKAVLNLHFYESAIFEQARAFQCLSLGTPVISEKTTKTQSPNQFKEIVHWFSHQTTEDFFTRFIYTEDFFKQSEFQLNLFKKTDISSDYKNIIDFASDSYQKHRSSHKNRSPEPWHPNKLHIGSGKDYRTGWLNIDIIERAQPDLVLDLSQRIDLPYQTVSSRVGPVVLTEHSADVIYANNVLEHVPDLTTLMTNCLQLLKLDGKMIIEVPYERALSAWQDPTHVRAFNENSWLYYTDWFWYLGWFDYRMKIDSFEYLNNQLKTCTQSDACFMKVTLTKEETSLAEKMKARTMQADFGSLPSDLLQ